MKIGSPECKAGDLPEMPLFPRFGKHILKDLMIDGAILDLPSMMLPHPTAV